MTSIPNVNDWQKQAHQFLVQGNYLQAANLYEQAIEAEPDIKSHYWNLGLMLLLQGKEVEAQATWLIGLVEDEAEQEELQTAGLVQVLQTEAERREAITDFQSAWAIRQHIKEINPQDINNLLHIILLSIHLKTFTATDLTDLEIIELLHAEESAVNSNLLLQVLKSLLDYDPCEPLTITFTEVCLRHAHEPQTFIDVIMLESIRIAYLLRKPKVAAHLAELCLRLNPDCLEVLVHLSAFYQDSRQYIQGIEIAKRCYALAKTKPEQIFANHLVLRSLMSATGYWQEAISSVNQQQSLINSIIKAWPTDLNQAYTLRLFYSTFFFPYFNDNPRNHRLLQNDIARLCQDNIQIYAKPLLEKYCRKSISLKSSSRSQKVIKIGYISHCFKRHSVGWLSRWIFQHHDPERFQIYAYLVNQELPLSEFSQQWFANNAYRTYGFKFVGNEVLEQIYQDQIDILVELDSITLDAMCEVIAIKPAPIQVTWLGWDASGLPTVDYFIADPYVLPDSAQKYYTEKIWRLPQTYIAIDGFEVGVPDLRRDQLDVPSDAVVYLVGQKGYKRNPDNAQLQMKILKEVPNSYLLIKGQADQTASKSFFEQIAEEVGVSCDRLRFLPPDISEEVHRANLGIADVVLDTYPYNGATTTLETLWMGIPLVTRVGQQFAARNSYSMMMNAGVTEGIAWTDEEYVEWGVRLGKDAALRQQISWRLRQSRQTAPLWNGEQFTREMEKAYEQMWQTYLDTNQ